MKFLVLIFIQLFSFLNASELKINVINITKSAMPDIVVTLEAEFNQKPYTPIPKNKIISQINNKFEPFITIINLGSKIQFPNYDLTAHHVYSFSPAKTFELKLYTRLPEQAITFDKVGPVSLGCGIHDSMEAYIFVTDKKHVKISNKYGQVRFKNLSKGNYKLTLWHPYDNGVYEPKSVYVFSNRNQSMTLVYQF